MVVLAIISSMQSVGDTATGAWDIVTGRPLAVILLLLAGAILVFGQWHEIKRWLGFADTEYLKREIRGWLDGLGYSTQTNTDPNFYFSITAERFAMTQEGARISENAFTVVSSKKDLTGWLILVISLGIDEPIRLALKEMPERDRNRAIAAVQVDIAGGGFQFVFDNPKDPAASTLVQLQEIIYVGEGLSQRAFIEGVQRLRYAVVVASNSLKRETASPPAVPSNIGV
jgi:hypothetical protein